MFEGSLRLLWVNLNFGGNWFWLSLWKKEYPIMLNTLQEMDFYLKGFDFGVWMLNCKNEDKNSTGCWRHPQNTQAEPI